MASLTQSVSDEKVTGRVYTPEPLVRRILDSAGYEGPAIRDARILDPACGDGQFLVEVVRRILDVTDDEDLPVALGRVHGWDIDEAAVGECRARLDALVAPRGVAVHWNVAVRNSLHAYQGTDLFSTREGEFRFVVGNPPYVRIQHLDEGDRALIQQRFQFCGSGSTDLYIAFFELALSLIEPGGVVAFVTPNTYFHTATARPLRRHLAQTRALRELINFGHRQVFPNATTYAAITVLSNRPSSQFTYVDSSGEQEVTLTIETADLASQDVWRLGSEVSELDAERYRPLRELARVHVGLATLADPVFIVRAVHVPGSDPAEAVLVDTKPFGQVEIERGLLRPVVKGSKVKQGQPCHQGAYVLFPYDTEGRRPTLLPEPLLAERFPRGYAYLVRARSLLDRRDNGRPNPVGWYAFGRSQALATGFGPKIICPPMAKRPTFVVCSEEDSTIYSGYFIRYDGDLHRLADQLNSSRMEEYVRTGTRDFMGGWKGYTKASFQNFPIDVEAL